MSNDWGTFRNPANLPRPRTREEWQDSRERVKRTVAERLQGWIDHYDIDTVELFGKGYEGVYGLSAYSAATALGIIDLRRLTEEAREAQDKRRVLDVAAVYYGIRSGQPVQSHPVFRCSICRGSRPHTKVSGWLYACDSCGTREDVSA